MRLSVVLLLLIFSQQSCGQVGQSHRTPTADARPGVKAESAASVPLLKSPDSSYSFVGGMRLRVVGKALQIIRPDGRLLTENKSIIRLPDESGDCPSEGFLRIVVKGTYFTVEQQACGGWMFVHEYATFVYSKSDGKVTLHKLGYVFTDRREPDKDIPEKILTGKNFGSVSFEDTDLEKLAEMQ